MARTSRTSARLFSPSDHSHQPAHKPLSMISFVSVFVQVLFAEGSWGLLVAVVVHLFSLLYLISAISILSVVASSHFAHVSILRPSLLLLMSCRSTFVQHDPLESPPRHTLYNACSNPPFTSLLDLLHRLAALHAFFLFGYTINLRLALYIIVKSEIPYCPSHPRLHHLKTAFHLLGLFYHV